MASVWKRRGQTWQDAEWRRFLAATDDLSDRARAAFAKLQRLHAAHTAVDITPSGHDLARTQAPMTDGLRDYMSRPNYRGFA